MFGQNSSASARWSTFRRLLHLQLGGRPFLRPFDLFLLFLLLLTALLLWGYLLWSVERAGTEAPAVARVYVEKEEVLRIPLLPQHAQLFPVPGREAVVLERRADGSLQVLHSDCPDQICVHTGPLFLPGQANACLPNQVFLRIEAQGDKLSDTEEAGFEADVVIGQAQTALPVPSASGRTVSSSTASFLSEPARR